MDRVIYYAFYSSGNLIGMVVSVNLESPSSGHNSDIKVSVVVTIGEDIISKVEKVNFGD